MTHPLENFEKKYQRLETLVAELEAGNLPLSDMLQRFEESVRILKECDGMLHTAEERVELLLKDIEGNVTGSEPFDAVD